jgi:hypothetical protein
MKILDIPDIGYIHLPSVTEFSETDIGCIFLEITAEQFSKEGETDLFFY